MSANPSTQSSLHWVQGELAQSLNRVRTLLEQHMETPANQLPLQQAVVELHQVRGTASMMQFAGVVALTDEMKLALQDLLQGRIKETEAAYAAMLGASVQLGDYIDALASGLEDALLVFQPAINELRLARGKPALTEAEMFAEQPLLAATPVTLPPADTRKPGAAKVMAAKFQPVFQQNLLQWIKAQDVQLALGRLGKIAEQLAACAVSAPHYQLWRMAAAVAEALLTKGLEESSDLKRLYGRAAAQMKALADHGEEKAAAGIGTLPYQFLFYAGRSKSQGPRVMALRNAYPLGRLLPSPEVIDQLRQRMRGPNTALLTKLSEEIRKELTQVKDHIDLVVRSGDKAPANLNDTVEKLNRVATTLTMLGLSSLQGSVQAQARVLSTLKPREVKPSDPVWIDVATALLRVEHTLDDALFHQLKRRGEAATAPAEDAIPGLDVREGRDALVRELLVDLARIKTDVDNYLKTGDVAGLPEAAKLLGQLQSGMFVLQAEKGAAAIGQLRDYLSSADFGGVRNEKAQAERFADAIAAMEYYLEATRARAPDTNRLVENIAAAVKKLDISSPRPKASSAPAPAPMAAAPASMAMDEVDPEIRDIFLEEAAEVIGQLKENLPQLKKNTSDKERWTEVRRSFHTLKGSGRMVGARDIGEFAWSVENLINRCIEGTHAFDPPVMELVDTAVTLLPELIESFKGQKPVAAAAQDLQNRAHRMAKGGDDTGPDQQLLAAFTGDARERLGDVRAWVKAQDRGKAEFPVDDRVVMAFHTLRGSAALLNAQGISGLSGQLEDYLNALRGARMLLPQVGLQLVADSEPTLAEWVDRLAKGSAVEPDLKPWARRLAEVQESLPASALEAAHELGANEQFAHEAFTKLEEMERVFMAWREQPSGGDFHARELARMLQMLHGDAVTAQCEGLGQAAAALGRRVNEYTGRNVPDAAFFREVPRLVEHMYTHLDDFREGKIKPYQETIDAGTTGTMAALAPMDQQFVQTLKAPVRPAQVAEPPPVEEAIEMTPVAEEDEDIPAAAPAEAAFEETIEAVPPVQETAEGEVDPELVSIFLGEADELMESLDRQFNTLEKDPGAKEPLAEVARALHTLKGGARMAGQEGLGTVAHKLETLIEHVSQGRVKRDGALNSRLHNVMDGLYRMLDAVKRGEKADEAPVLRDLEGSETAAPEAVRETTLEVTLPAVPQRKPSAPEPAASIAPGLVAAAKAAAAPEGPSIAYDPDLAQIFTSESAELMETLEAQLVAWQADAHNEEALREVQRALHTLKGGARMAGLMAMGTVAHEMESRVDDIAEARGPVPAEALAALHSHLSQLQRMQGVLERGEGESLAGGTQAEPMPARAIEPEVERFEEPVPPPARMPTGEIPRLIGAGPSTISMPAMPAAPAVVPKGPWDPALFWKPEDTQGMAARQRETARVGVEQLDKMMNEAGEISIYRSRIEQNTSALTFQLNELQQTIERVREHLRALELETETQIAARGFSVGLDVKGDKRADFDPLEMDRFSRMQELSRTLSESVGDVAALRVTMDDQLSEAETLLMQQGRVNTEIQQGLMATLMVPFSRQVQRLQRVVRQTAQESGKQADIVFEGIEQEMDRNVLERMVAPMEHLLRNSVVHGIEAPAARKAAGKVEQGTIKVNLRREGTQLAIEVQDDGQGLNYAAIRKTAVERGLMAKGAKLRDQEVAMFIFEAGFSTAKVVTQTAGRGVGMDVVASEVKQLGGTLELSSEPGKGTRFMIRLPLTLAMSQALLVGVGTESYAIPLPTIESIARVQVEKLPDHMREDGNPFIYGGQEYAVRTLAALIETPGYQFPEDAKSLPVVLVRLGEGLTGADRRVAVVVDQLFGNREVVSKAVGPQVASVQGISGGTILPDGRVVLILDVPALVTNRARRAAVAEVAHDEVVAAPMADERQLVMVVDDSITIRRVTERLLTRSGYRVIMAKDGLDAMTQLQTESPDVMLLDIEMPRADGFEVATFVRNNERIKGLPIIMITSRSGEKHRERARQIGVNGYLIKPYQEDQLLSEVRDLLAARRF
jgi:chemosensory pili system protein ChpA (sensor histidine kinase/response regulator)